MTAVGIYFAVLAVVVGLGLPLAVAFASHAQARAAAAALEGIARQPEASGSITISLLISLGLIESLVIYVLVAFFAVQGRLPNIDAFKELIAR
ncbi:MAG: ATP synthase F0 subunit C [Armatimonadetes bacterium]|nr:ATP synthase F0 subunit C [Armatimonadota bacterium]MDW8122961.1 ATP synthase F0 subunit C [Armatimonadota bacterium]